MGLFQCVAALWPSSVACCSFNAQGTTLSQCLMITLPDCLSQSWSSWRICLSLGFMARKGTTGFGVCVCVKNEIKHTEGLINTYRIVQKDLLGMFLFFLHQVHAGSGGHVGFSTVYNLFLLVEVRLPSVSHCAHRIHCHRDGHQSPGIQRLGPRAGQSVCLCVCLCVCVPFLLFKVSFLF